jgi:F0F1-type ATP synthase assembly protein I
VVERNDPGSWIRLAGLGFELAASVGGGAMLGWWLDRQLGSSPRALIIASAVGAVGGIYNLVRSALAAGRESSERAATRRDGER